MEESRGDSTVEKRRALYKPVGSYAERAEERRALLLLRQNDCRRERVQLLRRISAEGANDVAVEGLQDEQPQPQQSPRTTRRSKKSKKFHPWTRSPLCQPEWLIEPPEDLGPDRWFVRPRPEGKKCIVVAAGGQISVRDRNGWFLHRRGRLLSALPGGSPVTDPTSTTILDCIMPAEGCTKLFYVLDVMCWNDLMMDDNVPELRFFFAESRIQEVEALYGQSGYHQARFIFVPYYPADAEGLVAAREYCVQSRVSQDGILLYSRFASYPPGLTPLVLTWKDPACSAHWIETFPEPPPPDVDIRDLPLIVALRYDANHSALATCDEPPVLVSTPALCTAFEFDDGTVPRPGDILRFLLLNVAEVVALRGEPLRLETARLQLVGRSSFTRGQADSWSRVLFQCLSRHHPITFDSLLSAADALEPVDCSN